MLLIFLAAIVLLPMVYTLTNSFMSADEVARYYSGTLDEKSEETPFHIIPDEFSLSGYYGVLVARPDYLISFWISLFLAAAIVLGQLVIASLAAYAFSFFDFRMRHLLFFLTIVLMMMPYQVTLVSNYIVLDKLGVLGGYSSIILPGIFSAFGVFLLRMIMKSVPQNIIEAAKVDGASHLRILSSIVLPNCRAGIVSLVVLSFIDTWNMIEQPLVFLKDSSMYPLSIYLAEVNSRNYSLSFAGGMLAMVPVLILFLYFEDNLIEGISATNVG